MRMTQELEADRLGLDYIGMNEIIERRYREKLVGEHSVTKIYYFNDLLTRSTIAVFDLKELEDKVIKSRKKFDLT